MAMSPRLLRPLASGDPDARRYITAVQAADQQALEPAVRKAITDFVTGCKQDGIWSAIQASCILAGARTLAGALVPLKGPAPTNNNFASGDYNRETGLVGNGSTKWLNTNRNTNLDGQNDVHMAVYASTANTGLNWYIGAGVGDSGATHILSNATEMQSRSRNSSPQSEATANANGFIGMSRSSSANFIMRGRATNYTKTQASQAAFNGNVSVFLSTGSASFYSNARLAFYSTGGALNLALLDTRVSALITAIGAAI